MWNPFSFQHGIRAKTLFLAPLVRFWSSPVRSTVHVNSTRGVQVCFAFFQPSSWDSHPNRVGRHRRTFPKWSNLLPPLHAPPRATVVYPRAAAVFRRDLPFFAGDRPTSFPDLDLVLGSFWWSYFVVLLEFYLVFWIVFLCSMRKKKKRCSWILWFQILVVSDFWVLVCASCDIECVILMLFPLVVWIRYFGVVIPFRWISVVIAFGFVLGRALVWSCHPVPVDHSGDCIRVCVGTSSSLVPVWHVLVAQCWAFLEFQISALVLHQVHWFVAHGECWVLFVFGIIFVTSWMFQLEGEC